MSQERHGVNAITAGGAELLLTSTSGGSAVHLARLAGPGGTGRGAVHDFYFDASNQRSAALKRSYDQAALLAPRWASTTLCGREWAVMIAGEGGPFDDWSDEVAFSPSCRRCLTVMDKLFPAPKPDERLALVPSRLFWPHWSNCSRPQGWAEWVAWDCLTRCQSRCFWPHRLFR